MEDSKALANSTDVCARVAQAQAGPGSADWNAAMRRFYNVFPYPGRPLFVLPQVEDMALSHVGFACLLASGDTEWARKAWQSFHPGARLAGRGGRQSRSRPERRLVRQVIEEAAISAEQKQILLAGCGTDEAVLYGALHPRVHIDAVDLSARSLFRARLKWILYLLVNPITTAIGVLPARPRPLQGGGQQVGRIRQMRRIKFVCGDVEHVLQSGKLGVAPRYDHIVCFGVLHHQLHPKAFFAKLAQALRASGTVRLMVYTRSGRNLERLGQRLFTRSEEPFGEGAIVRVSSAAQMLFKALLLRLWILRSRLLSGSTAAQRFRYLGLTPSLAPVADALLHPCDPGLDPAELGEWVSQLGLRLVYCAAKSGRDGWLVGIEDPMQTWASILERERAADLVSNIELIVAR